MKKGGREWITSIGCSQSSWCLWFLAPVLFCGLSFGAETVETLTGSGNWTVPAGVTSVQVECWGAGGSGSARFDDEGWNSGPGGGGGAYVRSTFSVTPGDLIAYVVGQGVVNASGQDTWFHSSSTIKARGGSSASWYSGGAGGATASSIGDVKYSGGAGWYGGGSSAGTASNGVNATGSAGAVAPSGGGDGGAGSASPWNFAGSAGSVPGGGSGGHGYLYSSNSGTAGAAGSIRLTYTGSGEPDPDPDPDPEPETELSVLQQIRDRQTNTEFFIQGGAVGIAAIWGLLTWILARYAMKEKDF